MNRQWNLGWAFAFGCILSMAAPAQTNSQDEAAAKYAALGQQALEQGRYAEAQANFEKVEKLEPAVAEVHATLAAIYFEQREYDAAISQIRAAQRLKPGLPKLDSLLGLSQAELGQFAEALPRLEKGFNQTGDPEVRRMCGLQLLRAYTGLGRDADAVETALSLNRLYPDDPEVLYHTGRIYGNFAYLVMMRLHDKAPDSIWMLQAQGEANESGKNYDAALAAFQRVLAMDPRRPGIHYRMGRVLLARYQDLRKPDDRTAASGEFAAELQIDPDNGNANYELGVMASEDGNLEGALTRFEDVLNRFPDFEEALVALGGCYLQMSKPDRAVPPLERATRIRPDDEVAWYRLARAQRATGEDALAAQSMAEFKKVHGTILAGLLGPDMTREVTPQKLDADASSQ
jgi:tetratricopeptide (TPR) repeat protein